MRSRVALRSLGQTSKIRPGLPLTTTTLSVVPDTFQSECSMQLTVSAERKAVRMRLQVMPSP